MENLLIYCDSHPEIEKLDVSNKTVTPNEKSLLKNAQVLRYENFGKHKLFFMGSGVVGKGWGFIHGPFEKSSIIEPPFPLLQFKGKTHELSFIEHVKGHWYRFGV